MNNRLLHTPDGVRDIYGDEYEQKLLLQEGMRKVMRSYGYRGIETPTFEFFDVFSRDIGTTPSRELYKFFDKEGSTLVLRPDITPSVSRAVSRYFDREESTIRLCYLGNTFINHSDYQGRLKETTQLGAEMIGANSAQADAEIIAMAADCLKKAGLQEFQISIGQVEYFHSILRDIDLPEETEEQLKDFISNRNVFGVQSLLKAVPMDADRREALCALPSLYGSADVLDRAVLCSEEAGRAIDRLREVYRLLEFYGAARYVSFDLGMLSRYNYYTGIFFRGYTYGSGDAVLKGGRYDHLLGKFGKDAPSIGFVAMVDGLLSALFRQGIRQPEPQKPLEIRCTQKNREEAIHRAQELRREGTPAVLRFEEE